SAGAAASPSFDLCRGSLTSCACCSCLSVSISFLDKAICAPRSAISCSKSCTLATISAALYCFSFFALAAFASSLPSFRCSFFLLVQESLIHLDLPISLLLSLYQLLLRLSPLLLIYLIYHFLLAQISLLLSHHRPLFLLLEMSPLLFLPLLILLSFVVLVEKV